MRQIGGLVCRLHKQIARCTFPEEGSMEKSLSYQARRALLHQAVPLYREASRSQKRTLRMPLSQRLDIIVSTRCGSSTMRKKCNLQLSTPDRAVTDQKSNTRCSWSGMPLTASAPNALCLFFPRSSKRLRGMSISTSRMSAATNYSP